MMPSSKKNRFRRFVEANSSSSGLLPLVHTTSAYSFFDICEGSELATEKCKYFKKELIYLFYGRPSYRTQDSITSEIGFNYPILFVFDPSKIKDLVAVYPFDTGAFFLNLYSRFFDKRSAIDDFHLEPDLEYAKKLVSTFYGDNEAYMSGPSKKNLDVPFSHMEARGVQELSRQPTYLLPEDSSGRRIDERSSSIEVQSRTSIDIADCTVAIILPQVLIGEPEVVDAIARWKIDKVRTYEVVRHLSPGAWMPLVYDAVSQVYRELGYLGSDED